MSEDLDDLSSGAELPELSTSEPVVDETPVASSGNEDGGQLSAGADVFQVKGSSNNTVESYISERVAEETGSRIANGADNDRGAVTQVGRDAKEEEKEKKKEELANTLQIAEDLRKREKEKEDNFGMSAHDLTKIIDFISNNDLKEKLQARLTKNGMSPERAKKAMAEFQELADLKKKQDKGETLTAKEQERMEQLRKSRAFKILCQGLKIEHGIESSIKVYG